MSTLLARRSSSRDVAGAITLENLSALLAPLVDKDGRFRFATIHGMAAFRILCLINNATDLSAGTYWFNTDRGELIDAGIPRVPVAAMSAKTNLYLGLGDTARPPALIVACIASWWMLNETYHGATLANSYWDAGGLIAHLYLTCTEAGLNGCACAALDDGSLVSAAGLDTTHWGHVGTFAVGRDEPSE